MLIALDFDGTFTEDPDLWVSFVRFAKRRGHRVICATMRYESEGKEVAEALAGEVDQIVFTGRKAKRPYLQSVGLEPDVWIDDEPRWILEGG